MIEAAPLAAAFTEAPPLSIYIDTHAHLHFDDFAGEVDGALLRAEQAGVGKVITVGVNTADSGRAVKLASTYQNVWASVGIHPHEAEESEQGLPYLRELANRRKVVAIGECGLDFYKSQTDVTVQVKALRSQIELALELNLPLIFHVRDAFSEFFKVANDYSELRGVVHSFTAGPAELDLIMETDLMVALNGIVTFSKDESQLEAAKAVPSDRLMLETDCPFLSPVPYRGKTNEPARIKEIAEFLAGLRGESSRSLGRVSSQNAERLFGLA